MNFVLYNNKSIIPLIIKLLNEEKNKFIFKSVNKIYLGLEKDIEQIMTEEININNLCEKFANFEIVIEKHDLSILDSEDINKLNEMTDVIVFKKKNDR